MKDIITLTEAKTKFSEIISRIIFKKNKISITKKGKMVAVILPIDEYQAMKNVKKEGLILAKGALTGIDDDIDKLVDFIYKERDRETSREIPL